MRQSESLVNFSKAFVAVQAALKPAIKDRTNPHFRSQYADLSSVWDACKDALTKNGFGVIQCPEKRDESIVIITRLLHSSGEYIESELAMKPMDSRPQSDGSAITYGRRYALAAMIGVCPDDDDGNDASGRGEPQQQKQQPPKAKAPEKAQQPPKDKRQGVNDTIPITGTNCVYPAYKVRMAKLVQSDDGKLAWPGGSAELKAWVVTAKGHSFKSWSEVETCIESDRLEKLMDVILAESARRVNEASKSTTRETVGAY